MYIIKFVTDRKIVDLFSTEIALTNGRTRHDGRVRIHARGKEHWICGQDFDEKMASALCIFMQYE